MTTNKITLQRIIKGGIIQFFRGGLVSVATVLVMSLSMLVLGGVMVGSIFVNGIIESIEEKVDITVYFKLDTDESQILAFSQELESLPQVQAVQYVSKEAALEEFLERHKGDALILRSIETVETNPFSANIDINATDPEFFETITQSIERSRFSPLIDVDSLGRQKITYRQNEAAISRLAAMMSAARTIGFGASAVLALIALMVAYNTVRIAIHQSKEEIAVMQLVGATRQFVRGPFVVEGIIHGIISAVFTIATLYPVLYWVGTRTSVAFGGVNIYTYFVSNIFQISFLLLVVGILLGTLSAQFAMKRYLKV